AGQTEVERLLHVLAPPAVGDDFALEHLEQQPRPPAGGVHLLAGHHVARAHRAAGFSPALADPDAAQGGVGEAAPVLVEGEVRLRLGRSVVGAEAQVLVDAVGIDHLARVHLASGSQRRLNSRNACMISGPNIFGRNSARAWPSPCSPDSDPPYLTTRSAASLMKARNFSMPARVSRSKSMRSCRQPWPKWP